jgi:hypothetical protein
LSDANNFDRVFIFDGSGYTWWGFIGLSDGCNSGTNVQLTVSSYSVDNDGVITLTVNETLYTDGGGLAGVIVHRISDGTSAEIVSNTASVITLAAPGFNDDDPPVAGETMYLGRIEGFYRTSALSPILNGESYDANLWWHPKHVTLGFRSTNKGGLFRIKQWRDWETNPEDSWEDTDADFVQTDGAIAYENGYHVVDGAATGGWGQVPAITEALHHLTVDVVFDVPGVDYSLYAITVESDTTGQLNKDNRG